jgi:hypothetical protein
MSMDYELTRILLNKNIGKDVKFNGKPAIIGYKPKTLTQYLFWGTPDPEDVLEYAVSVMENPNYLGGAGARTISLNEENIHLLKTEKS